MPTSDEILAGLSAISNQAFRFAVAWHLVVAVVWLGVALLPAWRPSPRVQGLLMVAPLVSVSAFAAAYGNAFNAAAFAVLSITLVALGSQPPREEARSSGRWAGRLGLLLIGFAWVYPHFLVGRSPLEYLAGAPLGLIPSPTLALVTGFALLGVGPRGRSWSFVLGTAGVLYALAGALRLGVWIDLVLLVGAGVLLDQVLGRSRTSQPGGLISSP